MVFMTSNQTNLLSKIATGDGHGENSPYFHGWKAYDSDPFHPQQNPNGVIQMGLAENQLCFDLIEEWLLDNQNASICTTEGVNEFKDIANFQDYGGLPEFRNAVSNFMAKVRGNRVTFNPANIVMSGGATGAHETLAFCLADPGDAFLVPTPYYPGFDRNFGWRTGVQLLPVVCDSSNDFKVTRDALEATYEGAQESNIRVKGLLISNPSNPLGTVLDKETLLSIVTFVNEKHIHLICDEIYAATVFNQPNFISVSDIIEEDDVQCNRDLVHIVYSLSKDMGFAGFRVGIIYSYNEAVVSCAHKMSPFGLVSTETQYLIAAMLSDDEFIRRFVVGSRKRLARRHRDFTWGLSKAGIQWLKSNAGLFLWMDLRKLLKDQTFEAEMELWGVMINEVKLNVSPGSSFYCSEPGWFRVCFASMDDETVQVALSRIREFALLRNVGSMSAMKRMWRQQRLRLNCSSRRFDELMMSPCLMSPRSPMPQSPFIRATN